LQPASYVIRQENPTPPGNSLPSSNILEILSPDETQVYVTITSMPEYRPPPPDKPVLTFYEREQGMPRAIKGWWPAPDPYPYEEQFAYPRTQAMELMRNTKERVQMLPSDAPASPAPVAGLTAQNGRNRVLKASVGAKAAASPQPESSTRPSADTRLPKTASDLPLLALLGLLASLAGLMVRAFAMWIAACQPESPVCLESHQSRHRSQRRPIVRAARLLISGAPVTLHIVYRTR
jgi:hypothetical protein